jgi:hypothetical protein
MAAPICTTPVSVSTSSLFFLILKQIDPPDLCRQRRIIRSVWPDLVPPPQQAHDSKRDSSLQRSKRVAD